jgi:multidrug efflux system outer membrane protein
MLMKYLLPIFLILFSGCSFAPKYVRPPLPTAETYPGQECAQGCTNIRQLRWEDYFTDPALRQLISLALANNRDMRIAIQRMIEARGVYGLQWGEQFPVVEADLASIRGRVPKDFTPKKRSFIFSAYVAALSVVSWEIDFWGRLRSLADVELENYLASAEARCATFISLISQVANTYLVESELNELICATQKTIAVRQDSYRIMQLRFEEGASSKYEFLEAESLLQQAIAELAVLQRKRDLNWNAMTLLVGVPLCPNTQLLSQIEPYFLKEICPGLPSELLCNRPDVLAAEHKLLAANANIGAVRASFFPKISLTGSFGTASRELKNLFHPGQSFWAFIPDASLPIFALGKTKAAVDLSKARLKLAVAEYEQTIQKAFREVADALAEQEWLEKQMFAQKELLAAQSERARLAWIRFQYSTSPFFEVLETEQDRFSAEQAYVQTWRSWLASRINLYSALGGGYCR